VDGPPAETLREQEVQLGLQSDPTKLIRGGLRSATRWVERLVRLVLGQSMRPFGLPSAKVLCREIPINQFIQHCVDIVRAPVLIIQIVGVFPHVDSQ
jgi:hypothetical protein